MKWKKPSWWRKNPRFESSKLLEEASLSFKNACQLMQQTDPKLSSLSAKRQIQASLLIG